MSPVIYVSPAFRTACAEPRGALLLLHSDPVRSAPIVGSAASGARLLILCEQNGWCHVRTRTACGWVSKTDIVLFTAVRLCEDFVKSVNFLTNKVYFHQFRPFLLLILHFHLRCLKRYSIM